METEADQGSSLMQHAVEKYFYREKDKGGGGPQTHLDGVFRTEY
jgi:hypothetical protein